MTQTLQALSLDRAKTIAPAIFATEPASYINRDRYQFVPTTEIIEKMDQNGWMLTQVKQSKSKSDLRINYGMHIVQFQHPDLYVKSNDGGIEGRPTLVFINSHDGTKPLQAELGLFRLVCENGLIIKSQDFGGFRERHTRLTNDEVQELIEEKIAMMGRTVGKINDWSQINLNSIDMRKFATDALLLRINSDRTPDEHEVASILEARRDQDKPNTLWHTYNRVQENLIKGGFQIGERTARGISNPMTDMVLNQGLWQLAEEFAASAN
jgi:hypothetical protein